MIIVCNECGMEYDPDTIRATYCPKCGFFGYDEYNEPIYITPQRF